MSNTVPAQDRRSSDRTTAALIGLVLLAIAVSVVHYADNYVNYDAYPVSSSAPTPSQTLVGLSWFLFTAFGVLGVALFLRGRATAAAVCLALYSGSGLVGIGHYTVPGATDMPWWRQAHVIADVLCGVALLGFAIWIVRRPASSARH